MSYINSFKGATYERVVIIPAGTTLPFIEKQAKISSNQTKAKFYIAYTRAKHSVIFVVDKLKETAAFKPAEICIADIVLPAYKFETSSVSANLK